MIAGSITLTGGHGTAGAWGEILETQHGIQGALALGMASATFGLIIGGVIGGPLAKLLINRYSLAQPKPMLKSKIATHILNKIQMTLLRLKTRIKSV